MEEQVLVLLALRNTNPDSYRDECTNGDTCRVERSRNLFDVKTQITTLHELRDVIGSLARPELVDGKDSGESISCYDFLFIAIATCNSMVVGKSTSRTKVTWKVIFGPIFRLRFTFLVPQNN